MQEDELKLKYDLLLSIDGGMSLKRFGDAGGADGRAFNSDYFLSRQEVDVFANEKSIRKRKRKEPTTVKKPSRKKTTQPDADGNKPEDGDSSGSDDAGVDVSVALNPTGDQVNEAEWLVQTVDGLSSKAVEKLRASCVDRWKANADDSKKGMFSCFDESGVFVAVCRHHIVLVLCDIVTSGEL